MMAAAMGETDKPGVSELIGSALASGDLAPRAGPCGLDKVMALGLLGMRDKMADVVMRLKYANSADTYHDAQRAITELARRLDQAENWRMQSRLPDMAKAVLDYWLDDICEECGARKVETERMGGTSRKITGAADLEEQACPACQGFGKRKFPWAAEDRKGERVARCHTVLLIALEETERRVTGGLVAKLFSTRPTDV